MAGRGRAGALMRSVDWASTPPGAVESWPDSPKDCGRIACGRGLPVYEHLVKPVDFAAVEEVVRL
jgi:hypothetical protein